MNNILNPYNIDITKASYNHNYISDKLILDSLNGIMIANDHNLVSKSRNSFIRRNLDSLSGTSKKRQEFINENFINSINGALNYLKDHDANLNRVHENIAIVANEIFKTQNEMLKFYDKHKTLQKQVDDFRKFVFEQYKEFDRRVKKLEINNEIIMEISFLRSGNQKYAGYSIPLKLYSLVDNLFSGNLGLAYKQDFFKDSVAFLQSEIIIYLKDENLIDKNLDFTKILQIPDKNDKRAINFISANHYDNLLEFNHPNSTHSLINLLSSKEAPARQFDVKMILDYDYNIPKFLTYNKFSENCIREIKNSTNLGAF